MILELIAIAAMVDTAANGFGPKKTREQAAPAHNPETCSRCRTERAQAETSGRVVSWEEQRHQMWLNARDGTEREYWANLRRR